MLKELREREKRTRLNSDSGVVHMAPDMGEDLGAETKLADGLAIKTGLLRCSGRCQLNVFDTKGIQCLGDSDLGLGVEESVCELFPL